MKKSSIQDISFPSPSAIATIKFFIANRNGWVDSFQSEDIMNMKISYFENIGLKWNSLKDNSLAYMSMTEELDYYIHVAGYP